MAGLRIMTLNLLVDRADPSDLRRVLSEVEPDVLAVQELGGRTAAVIADVFPHGHLDPREDLFGLGIAARREVTVQSLPLEARPGWIARLEPGAWPTLTAPVEVMCIHLLNPIERPWGATRDARRAQVEATERSVWESDSATVVIGDMNSTPRWAEYRRLAALGVDAARATGTEARTWAHFTRGPRWLRIDHAFVAGVTPIRTEAVSVRGTDHLALVVDIEV